MKRWLPYVIAVLLGVGVAIAMFWPSTSTSPTTTGATSASAGASTSAKAPDPIGEAPGPADPGDPVGAGNGADAAPREATKAEVANNTRRARPYNQHYQLVSSFWRQTERLAAAADAEIARECGTMEDLLRSQSRLNEDEADIAATLQKEIALAQKVKAANLPDGQIGRMMDYILASAQVTMQGGDPSTVHRPTPEELRGG